MEFDQKKSVEFRENHKTQFMAGQFDALMKRKQEALALVESDPSMKELAEEEVGNIQKQLEAIYEDMSRILEESKVEEERPYGVVLEVRAGAGGDEASLFAAELAEMYQKFAELKGWRVTVSSTSESSQGGYKEGVFEIIGGDVYDALR